MISKSGELVAISCIEVFSIKLDDSFPRYPQPFDSSEMLAGIGAGRRMVELHRELEGKNVKLDELASTDSLTGLPNRRAIEEWADKHA